MKPVTTVEDRRLILMGGGVKDAAHNYDPLERLKSTGDLCQFPSVTGWRLLLGAVRIRIPTQPFQPAVCVGRVVFCISGRNLLAQRYRL